MTMDSVLPDTVDRVAKVTSDEVNERIREESEEHIRLLSHSDAMAIEQRLGELDREWDIERTLEANAASAVLISVALGATVDRRFFLFPAVIGGFLLQHALQGWCPPISVFRRLGIRTSKEIEQERYALKAMRGDFELVDTGDAERAINAVRA